MSFRVDYLNGLALEDEVELDRVEAPVLDAPTGVDLCCEVDLECDWTAVERPEKHMNNLIIIFASKK